MLHIDRYLLEEAEKEVKTLKEQGKRIGCIWDGRDDKSRGDELVEHKRS
jgi:hypothetical protein